MANYRIDVYHADGLLQSVITDFETLTYNKQVNSPGIISLTLYGEHKILKSIQDKWKLEVWRKPDNGIWAKEITGLLRSLKWKYANKPSAILTGNGILSILAWRHVLYSAGVEDRTKFTNKKAESIAKDLVKYNATNLATTGNGRLRDGSINGLSVSTNNNTGNTINWFCAYDNLLATLQELSKIGDGDFDLIQTSPNNYEFMWYPQQLGTNRTDSVLIAMERGNMANPVYTDERSAEKSVAIVGGQGELSDRAIEIVTGGNYNITHNNIETFVSATDVDNQQGLITRGNQRLQETKVIRTFSFEVIQTPGCEYGKHYFLGDIVSVKNPYMNEVYSMKIASVGVSLDSNGKETIKIGVEYV